MFSLHIWVEWVILRSWFTPAKVGRCEFQQSKSRAEAAAVSLARSPERPRPSFEAGEVHAFIFRQHKNAFIDLSRECSVWVNCPPLLGEDSDDGGILCVHRVDFSHSLMPVSVQDNDCPRGWELTAESEDSSLRSPSFPSQEEDAEDQLGRRRERNKAV